MKLVRDRWRRSGTAPNPAELDTCDATTALIVLALLIACIVSFAAIVRAGEPAIGWLDLGSAGLTAAVKP
jgi:hypothetical protein